MSHFEPFDHWPDEVRGQSGYMGLLALNVLTDQEYKVATGVDLGSAAMFGASRPASFHDIYDSFSSGLVICQWGHMQLTSSGSKSVKYIFLIEDDRQIAQGLTEQHRLSKFAHQLFDRVYLRKVQKHGGNFRNRGLRDKLRTVKVKSEPTSGLLAISARAKSNLSYLPFHREFAPSSKIVAVVNSGIAKFIEDSGHKNFSKAFVEFQQKSALADRAHLIAKSIREIVSTVSFRQIDGIEGKRAVTAKGSFNAAYLNLFAEVLPIWVADIGEFQSMLRQELIEHLASGGKYSGAWGELKVLDGELVIAYAANNVPRLGKGWNRAAPMNS